MSRSVDMAYILRKERQRKLYLKRIDENTRFYLAKYEEMYHRFRGEGYIEFVPEEMSQLKQDLQRIRDNINSNIEVAMQLSKNIGDYIYGIRTTSENVRNQLEDIAQKEQERLVIEQREAKNKRSKMISEKLLEIKDPIVRDFAYDLSYNLKQKANQNDLSEEKITRELEKIMNDATSKAFDWKKKQVKSNEKSNERERIKAQIEFLKNSTDKSKKVEEVISEMESIERNVDNMDIEDVKKVTNKKVEEAEKEILDEKIRKEVVNSLYKSLKNEGFIISNPQIDKDINVVTLKANKPSGNRALCKIELDGKFSYKFDGYEGMSCLKDMEKVNKELQKIYGIELKEEKIKWENPNRVLKDANSMPSSNNNRIGD